MSKESYVPQYRIKDLTTSDNNYVHKTGNETISGIKSFTANQIRIYNNSISYTDTTKSQNGQNYINFWATDKQTGYINSYLRSATQTSTSIAAYFNDGTTTNTAELRINANKDGTKSTSCPEPVANNNTSYTNIATTGWVNDPTKSLNVVHRTGDETIAGTKTFSSTINGTALQAMWADLAENYTSDNKYEEGTLIEFGGNNEITIANKKVNGVISSKPALLLNSKEKGQPVALAGKVPVKVEGKINKFDKLILKGNGIARKKKWYEFYKRTIAISLEENNNEGIKKVLCVTKFNLD